MQDFKKYIHNAYLAFRYGMIWIHTFVRAWASRKPLFLVGSHSPIFAGNAFHFLKNTWRLPDATVVGVAPSRSYYLMMKAGVPWIPVGGWMARILGKRARAAFGTIRPILDIGPEVSGALQVELWHGMGLKGAGLQGIPEPLYCPEIDFTIATSPFTSEIQQKTFALPRSRVICSGEPGTDGFVDTERPDVLKLLGGRYQKIVLYAPTYRDKEFQKEGHENNNIVFVKNITRSPDIIRVLQKHNACMIIKLHPFVRNIYQYPLDPPFCSSQVLEVCIEYLMAASACLLSDYSSVVIDWMQLARPMILSCPDLDDYKRQRGFPYYDYEEMFEGLLAADPAAVALALDRTLSGDDECLKKVGQLRQLFHTYPAGGASKRLYDRILDEVRLTHFPAGA